MDLARPGPAAPQCAAVHHVTNMCPREIDTKLVSEQKTWVSPSVRLSELLWLLTGSVPFLWSCLFQTCSLLCHPQTRWWWCCAGWGHRRRWRGCTEEDSAHSHGGSLMSGYQLWLSGVCLWGSPGPSCREKVSVWRWGASQPVWLGGPCWMLSYS